MSYKKNFFIFSVAVLVFFAAAEIAARVLTSFFMVYDVEMAEYALRLQQSSENPFIGHVHKPGISPTRLMGVTLRTNSDGLRGPEYAVEKGAAYRIVLLGDSLTLGWGVDENKTFASSLEKKLNTRRKTEVLNFGVGNYNSEQEVNLFFERAVKYHPDEVVLFYFINDAEKTPHRSGFWFLAYSRFLTLVWSRGHALGALFSPSGKFLSYYANLYKENQEGWLRAQRALLRISRYCREQNISFRVVILPEFHNLAENPFKKEYGKVESLLDKNRIPYLDLASAFERYRDPYQFWVAPDDAHPNAKAHQLIADSIYDWKVGQLR